MPKKITSLTEAQKSQFGPWSEKWIEIGLRTGNADRGKFETAAKKCYEFSGLKQPKAIIWVDNPLVLCLAAPIASEIIAKLKIHSVVNGAVHGAVNGAVHGAVIDAVNGAVDGAVRGAVRGAVDGAVLGAVSDAVSDAVDDTVSSSVRGAVRGAIGDAVYGAVRGAVDGAVRGAVRGAVDGAVLDAVHGAVSDAVGNAVFGEVNNAVRSAVDGAVIDAVGNAVFGEVIYAVNGAVGGAVDSAVIYAVNNAVSDAVGSEIKKAIKSNWSKYIGGQFWCGGWWYGSAYISFFLDVCNLDIGSELKLRAKSYHETIESACWWWPHEHFIMVCERPLAIHRELVDNEVKKGLGSHRLHNENGPAVEFRGWSIYSIHGVRVPEKIVMAPESITINEIRNERNAEVRRVMIDKYGEDRYIVDSGMKPVAHDETFGTLYIEEFEIGKPIAKICVTNRSPEPDGTFKKYWLPINPAHYNGDSGRIPQAAVASTWRTKPGGSELFFKKYQDYRPVIET